MEQDKELNPNELGMVEYSKRLHEQDKAGSKCLTCKTILNVPHNPLTRDCGGDCLACMAVFGDPAALREVRRIARTAGLQGGRARRLLGNGEST